MVSGDAKIKAGLIVFGLASIISLLLSIFLELTSRDFYCSVLGQNGRYCTYTIMLFMLAIIFLVLFCIGSLVWTAFTRYNKPFMEK